jgi:hypothetical protein
MYISIYHTLPNMKSVPVYDTETKTTKFVDNWALTVIVNKKYVKSEYREYFLDREDWISFTKLQRRVSQLGGAKPIKNILDIPKDKYVSENNKKTKINDVGNVEESIMKKLRTAYSAFGNQATTPSSSVFSFGNTPTTQSSSTFGNPPTTKTTTQSSSGVIFGNLPTTTSSSGVTVGNTPTTSSISTFGNPPTTKTTTQSSSGVTFGNLPTTPASSTTSSTTQTFPLSNNHMISIPSQLGVLHNSSSTLPTFTFGTKTTNPTINITPTMADLGYNYRVSYGL